MFVGTINEGTIKEQTVTGTETCRGGIVYSLDNDSTFVVSDGEVVKLIGFSVFLCDLSTLVRTMEHFIHFQTKDAQNAFNKALEKYGYKK